METDSPFKSDVVKDKVCLITGGGSGICFGIAEVYGKHGAKISIMGRRESVLKESVQKLKDMNIDAIYVQGDVRDFKSCEEAAKRTFEHFGALNTLVNGAAGNFLALAEDLSPNAFSTVIQIDLIGTFNMTSACLKYLKLSKQSQVINITARLEGNLYQSHAASAKAAIDALIKNLAIEWIPYGIRVNGIAPGPIKGTVGMSKLAPGSDGSKVDMGVPRWGSIDEIAYCALFLGTKVADYINGETIVVDGASSIIRPTLVPKSVYEKIKKKSKL